MSITSCCRRRRVNELIRDRSTDGFGPSCRKISLSLRVIFAPAAGLLAGYAVWLAICAAIIGTVPVSAWAAVYVSAFALLGLGCVIAAERTSQGSARSILRWAPVLPAISTAYLLFVFLA